ncbi:MAG: peptidoglycan-binding protein [Candidatus Electronema sp. V4]|uniref:peptidoglycan-binding protein n=1 Tax=Candidatus Electronema sp. V4 TaxID=3454756 RepID=UPI0040556549
MKNLLAYTPEPFDNLEIENFEYALLAGEMDMEEGEAWKMQRAVGRAPRRFPPVMRKTRMIKPLRPRVRLRYPLVPRGGAVNVFPPADDRRQAGQSSSSGNAGGEGSFGNAPAQELSSEHVRWVQETLNRALGLRLIVDGIMNLETRSAVRMFQERKGLSITGLMGPDTEEALRAEGGQAAAEPELLEGEWEMEEFVFEAEPFGEAEFENEYPTLIIDWKKYPNLADNVWQAQKAGHKKSLTYNVPNLLRTKENRKKAMRYDHIGTTYNIPRILSRDEYPFACTKEGSSGWVGHIPPEENSAQGGLIASFIKRHRIVPYDKESKNNDKSKFTVKAMNHPRQKKKWQYCLRQLLETQQQKPPYSAKRIRS